MEKIVQKILEWFVEFNNILSKLQCGFRQGLSTIDVLLRFENIRSSLLSREICLVIYLDLQHLTECTMSGLEKIPISLGLVTLLYICSVILT